MEYLREHGKLPDYVKILISTGGINSGIDINNECNFASMTITQKKYSSAKDIQTKARNRRGSHTIYTVIRGTETSVTKESYAQSFEYYEEKTLEQVKLTVQCLNELKQMCEEKLNCPCDMIVFNEETGKFEVDMQQVKKNALDLYDKDLTLNPHSLVKEIVENGTFTIEHSNIADCIEFVEAQEDEELKKELKEERKALKEFNKMKEIATKEILIKLKAVVDHQLEQLKKDYPDETEEKLMRKACRIYQAAYEDNAREYLEKETNVFALEGYTNEEIEMVERLQEVGEEHLIHIKELAFGNDKVCVTYGEAAYIVAKALIEDKEYAKNRTEELKKQRKELQALLKEKQVKIEDQINKASDTYEYKKKEINSKYTGKFTESKKEKKKEELKKIRTAHKETVKKLEKELSEYKKELRIPVINDNERSIGALIKEIKFKALAPTLIRAAINNYGEYDSVKLKKTIKQFESNKEIRKNILQSKKIEEVALYLKHLEVRTRITKEKLNNLYLDLAEVGFIDDADYKKQIGKHLAEYKKVDTKKIVIPTAAAEELLRKINIIFNVSDINRIWSLNI